MESRKNREFKNPDYLLDWVEKMMIDYETYYIIIDEVQEVEDFVEVLSSLSVTEGRMCMSQAPTRVSCPLTW